MSLQWKALDQLKVSVFFKIKPCCDWNDVQAYFKVATTQESAEEYFKIYTQGLEVIKDSNSTSENVKSRVRDLLERTNLVKFVNSHRAWTLEAAKEDASGSVAVGIAGLVKRAGVALRSEGDKKRKSGPENKPRVASTTTRVATATHAVSSSMTVSSPSSNETTDASTSLSSVPLQSKSGSPPLVGVKEGLEELNQLQHDVAAGHPFYELFQALYDIYHERAFQVPDEPEGLLPLQQALFGYVAKNLECFSKLSTAQQKDVYVAASSVAHLEMPDAATTFGPRLKSLQRSIYNLDFSSPCSWLADVLESLVTEARDPDTLQPNPLKAQLLAEKRIGELASIELRGGTPDALQKKVLEIIKIAASLCEQDIVARPKLTEAMTTKVWLAIFEILFRKSIVSVKIGEPGLSSSKNDRSANESNHGENNGPVAPRKVDFLLIASIEHAQKVEHVSLVNYEHKSPSASQESVDIQLRKNIRHNHSIMLQVPV
ncbi:unnamed protein product [Mortierella alpina]